jgi:hypothetical protein
MIETIDATAGTSRRGRAVYRLRVEGRLDELAFDYIDDLTLALVVTPGGRTVTTLTCGPVDQPTLVGLINLLHDFGLPLTLVERLD